MGNLQSSVVSILKFGNCMSIECLMFEANEEFLLPTELLPIVDCQLLKLTILPLINTKIKLDFLNMS